MKKMSAAMMKLSKALDVSLPLYKGKMVYLDYPVYTNVGDMLIWLGANEFFKRNGKKFIGRFSLLNMCESSMRCIEESDTICFQGGGNMGDLWVSHQHLRERIIEKFPHKRIIILPQSVHFEDVLKLDATCELYKKHPDLHIFLRDENSFSLLKDRGVPNLQLCPDMAHALWGVYSAGNVPKASGPLYLLRRDKEDSVLPPDINALRASAIDWDDIFTGFTLLTYKLGQKINKIDRRLRNMLPAFVIWERASDIITRRAISLFAPHDMIITNRLHAMILAALLEKKAIVYDNSYGKISSYADLWFKDVPGIDLRKHG